MQLASIAPSILTADFTKLGEQVVAAFDAGVDYIHIDVMDGHFVPNLTIGPLVVSALKPLAVSRKVLLDVHLMVERPETMLEAFADAGADFLTVHVETCPHLHRTVQQIHDLNCKAGVAINPATPLVFYEDILSDLDLVLIMSVNPGFGGQKFIYRSLSKIMRLRKMIDEIPGHQVILEVDGGIKADNAAEIAQAGAELLVIGSAIYNRQGTVRENIERIKAHLTR